MVLGYNISLTIGGKTLLGRTQDDLTISARTKESITKDDEGEKQIAVTGHDVTFKVSALMELSSSTSTQLDRDDVIALALATGDDAGVSVVYALANGASYSGTAIITGYSESSSADPDADTTISLDLKISGDFTIVS